jgi:hypothetical protein
MIANSFKIRASALGQIMTESREKSNTQKVRDLFDNIDSIVEKTTTLNQKIEIKQVAISKMTDKAVATRAAAEQSILKYRLLIQDLETEHTESLLSIATLEGEIQSGTDIKLSKSAKTYCEIWYTEFCTGRKKEFTSKQTNKGNAVENTAISILSSVFGELFEKKQTRKENEYMIGTCDIDSDGESAIIDVKSSYDLFTFPKYEAENTEPLYFWQLIAYCILYNRSNAILAYVLCDLPDAMLEREIVNAGWAKGLGIERLDLTEQELATVVKKWRYDDISQDDRVRIFNIDTSEIEVLEQKINARVLACRAYIHELEKTYTWRLL